jgi:hypothetical protein
MEYIKDKSKMSKLEIKKCVLEIIDSLCDRNGFDDWWYNLDDDIEKEITTELESIIERRLNKDKDDRTMDKIVDFTSNSKWVQVEKIKSQIEVLQELLTADVNKINLQLIMLRLGIELKQLENEK